MPEAVADLIVTGAKVWTQDADNPWAESIAVRDGVIVAVGTSADTLALKGADTEVHDVEGALIIPGLSDGHVHLAIGGSQAVYELPIAPWDDLPTIYGRVRAWAERLGPDEWIVGGIVGTPVIDQLVQSASHLADLDAAAGGRPVLLRDDTMHNRWLSSRALEILGVTPQSPNPEGGEFVRDPAGELTGVAYEMASGMAEGAFAASVADPSARMKGALLAAQQILLSFGITSVQEAATMASAWGPLTELDRDGEWTLKVVASMPVRPFLEAGIVGDELLEVTRSYRSDRLRPDFVKIVMDGVPMTRTAAMLEPYICHDHSKEDPEYRGDAYWAEDDLVAELQKSVRLGLGSKVHATGDRAIRMVLDAAEKLRETGWSGEPKIQIAHTLFVDPEDAPRYGPLGVVGDASPFIWYPSGMNDSMAQQVGERVVAATGPFRTLVDTGALVAAGSDWPCALPSPNPWAGLQAMVTRANPDPSVPGTLGADQALTVAEALEAFTVNPIDAMGLDGSAGRIKPGFAADFAVLDRNLFEVPTSDIHATVVLRTYANGRLVHDAANVAVNA
jgi:predicted amidohydrolase YtcJ